jgi:succinate dehydrogenase/fumarate reductase flavoprotein subunit
MRQQPRSVVVALFATSFVCWGQPDLIVTGAGVAGMAAALEAVRAGLRVTVVEQNSVFGGHAVISSGRLALVGTPLQARMGVRDTPALAREDFFRWGEDASEAWVRRYTEESKTGIYDWMTALGTEFTTVTLNGGGSRLPRFHIPRGQGLGLVVPLRRELLRYPEVTFLFATRVTGLVVEEGALRGVRTENLRTGEKATLRGGAVLLGTGGFASNVDLVRASWPKGMRAPERFLVGGGFFSDGAGMELVKAAGGTAERLDHQWNYATGLPDPFDTSGRRGYFATSPGAIWVNAQGKRFAREQHEPKVTVPAIAAQEPARFWAVFDSDGRKGFRVVHAGFGNDRLEELFAAPGLIVRGDTLGEFATAIGMPAEALVATVARFNGMVERGADTDFGRAPLGRQIAQPPFYAAPMYVLIRKSMGGIAVDEQCRVLNAEGRPIPGLLAAGEATGFGGINGKNGLEGTFLGASLFMGRVAAQTVAGGILKTAKTVARPVTTPAAGKAALAGSCKICHDIPAMVATPRAGYWHFERSHTLVTKRGLNCMSCHVEMAPYRQETHRIDRALQTSACAQCHMNTPGPL